MFKYAAEHNGIDTLADYTMDLGPDLRKVANPARLAARKTVAAAQAELVAAERALSQLLAGPGTPKQMNAALPAVHRQIQHATRAMERTKTALKGVPAKVLATELDPDAQRARPRLQRRGLQMVLRLLAFNAEAWLAEHFNADIPRRPERVPSDRAQPAPPRRADRLHQPADHRHPGPARQPARRPRPPAARRRTQRHPSTPTRRPPPADLPGHRSMSFNDDHSRT